MTNNINSDNKICWILPTLTSNHAIINSSFIADIFLEHLHITKIKPLIKKT